MIFIYLGLFIVGAFLPWPLSPLIIMASGLGMVLHTALTICPEVPVQPDSDVDDPLVQAAEDAIAQHSFSKIKK